MIARWRNSMKWLAVLAIAPAAAAAQQIRGTVVDSVSRLPIAGAVVSLVDGRDSVVARTLSGNGGVYTLPLPPRALRTRVVRIGFRPRDLPIVRGPDGNATVDIAMEMLPTLLVRAEVAAKQCPRRPDAEQAAGLWEQAVRRREDPSGESGMGLGPIAESRIRRVVRVTSGTKRTWVNGAPDWSEALLP